MYASAKLKELRRIRGLTRLMDSAFRIPGIGLKIGLDPIIGLIPGLGDIITTIISAYIVFLAARFRLPQDIIRKMIFNIGLETVVGAIPLLGDIFDAFYKSNVRNLDLLEKYLYGEAPELRALDDFDLRSVTIEELG